MEHDVNIKHSRKKINTAGMSDGYCYYSTPDTSLPAFHTLLHLCQTDLECPALPFSDLSFWSLMPPKTLQFLSSCHHTETVKALTCDIFCFPPRRPIKTKASLGFIPYWSELVTSNDDCSQSVMLQDLIFEGEGLYQSIPAMKLSELAL